MILDITETKEPREYMDVPVVREPADPPFPGYRKTSSDPTEKLVTPEEVEEAGLLENPDSRDSPDVQGLRVVPVLEVNWARLDLLVTPDLSVRPDPPVSPDPLENKAPLGPRVAPDPPGLWVVAQASDTPW